MADKTALVVTSISSPTPAMRELASGAREVGLYFYCVGDRKTPANFSLEGCEYLSMEWQFSSGYRYAADCPINHYARKNIGYLKAIEDGCSILVETDDDNFPRTGFWEPRSSQVAAERVSGPTWLNAFALFTDEKIWPRGFPLQEVASSFSADIEIENEQIRSALVQQGLADGDPDVDAVFRMTRDLPIEFDKRNPLMIGKGSWTTFNSQNTTWFEDAFPLLYLPSTCSFRMTDIWRSLVTQACLWAAAEELLYHEASVFQDRNMHDFLKDFEQEVEGYLNNHRISQILSATELKTGKDHFAENLRVCYSNLVKESLLDASELALVDCWLDDLQNVRNRSVG